MIVIRRAQFRAFEEAARRRFEKHLTRFLVPQMQPPVAFPEVYARVRDAVKTGLRFGIDETEDLEKWVGWQLLDTTRFDRLLKEAGVKSILENPNVPGTSKLAFLQHWMQS